MYMYIGILYKKKKTGADKRLKTGAKGWRQRMINLLLGLFGNNVWNVLEYMERTYEYIYIVELDFVSYHSKIQSKT